MQKCCKNSFQVCEEFLGCPEGLVIKVPPGYPSEDIIVRVYKNGKIGYEVEATIDEGGFVSIYDYDLPEGFLNPFGSTYSVQFVEYTTGEVYEFVIGQYEYDAIDFNLLFGESISQNFIIDIF